jgi:sugar lactone lactonase YvrE
MYSLASPRIFVLVVTLAVVVNPLVASASVGDRAADRVIGQPDASGHTPNFSGVVDDKGLADPFSVAFDASGNLYVADASNSRVLGYRSPMTTDLVADLVIGQPDFNSYAINNGGISASSLNGPLGVAVSAAGDLYVADSYNCRVLEYDRPFDTNSVADRVFGQPGFQTNVSNNGGHGPVSLNLPAGLVVSAAGDLWVVDSANHRVLMYEDPIATDSVADLALGQAFISTSQLQLFTNEPNYGGLSATSLNIPYGVAVDSAGNVWVADFGNSRVLGYDDPKGSDATADRVLGQPSFSTSVRNYTGEVDAAGLNAPSATTVDANGNVYVSDTPNNRVLMYTSPIATRDRIADRVFGQPDFSSNAANSNDTSADSLERPIGLAVDASGNVAVPDSSANRVVLLQAPTPIVTSIAVKVSRETGRRKLIVRGYGMRSGSTVVEVDGKVLTTTKYKELVAADGSARRVIATDPDFDTIVLPQVQVRVRIVDPLTGSRSAPVLVPEN